jgi:hypothetical protein
MTYYTSVAMPQTKEISMLSKVLLPILIALFTAQVQAAVPQTGASKIQFEYCVLSNIYAGNGLPPLEAASVILEKAKQILKHRAAGNRLDSLQS